ncbi:MAG: N-formylglutamate amidohydrolase [Chthoniobacterales bacterium]
MSRIVSYTTEKFVRRHRGTLPILLTCPHDGGDAPPGVTLRTQANTPDDCTGENSFKNGRDVGTNDITRKIARRMYQVFGESPYVVTAEFSRNYIDANRPSDDRDSNCAFVDGGAREFYAAYHYWVDKYVSHILTNNRNGTGFLFDIHGTQLAAADIYVGTSDGATLQPSFDRDDLFKRRGLVGLLMANKHTIGTSGDGFSFTVSPASSTISEIGEVSGGFTVRHYGGTINAIQLEVAREVRDNNDKKDILIEELAYTLVNFVRQHAGV